MRRDGNPERDAEARTKREKRMGWAAALLGLTALAVPAWSWLGPEGPAASDGPGSEPTLARGAPRGRPRSPASALRSAGPFGEHNWSQLEPGRPLLPVYARVDGPAPWEEEAELPKKLEHLAIYVDETEYGGAEAVGEEDETSSPDWDGGDPDADDEEPEEEEISSDAAEAGGEDSTPGSDPEEESP